MAEVITLPKMSDTMEEGTLVKWHVKLGDKIKSGDTLAEVETDKATMDLESYYDGEVIYLGPTEGEVIKVNSPILIIGKKGEDYKNLLKAEQKAIEKENNYSDTKQGTKDQASLAKNVSELQIDNKIKASPLAKKMAREKGLDIASIEPSTSLGRIIKRDIEKLMHSSDALENNFCNNNMQNNASANLYKDEPLSQMRKIIAERLSESKFTAPHFYVKQEINMDKLIALRAEINNNLETKISFNDFIVKAVAYALTKHKEVNASFLGDKIRYYDEINIGIAVAIEDGLVVPVVKNVNQKALSQTSNEIKVIAKKARDKKISPADMQGATFTISNLGMYGIKEFTSIINPPNACILAVGAINKMPIVDEDNNIKTANIMVVTLSADHRVVDGAKGAEFLQTLKNVLQEPLQLLI